MPKIIVSFFVMVLFAQKVVGDEMQIIFNNTSSNELTCFKYENNGYVPFIKLNGDQSRAFTNFKLGIQMSCSIIIEGKKSTLLTYFTPSMYGKYDLLLDNVPCSNCGPKNYNIATIVVFPNGEVFHQDFKGLK